MIGNKQARKTLECTTDCAIRIDNTVRYNTLELTCDSRVSFRGFYAVPQTFDGARAYCKRQSQAAQLCSLDGIRTLENYDKEKQNQIRGSIFGMRPCYNDIIGSSIIQRTFRCKVADFNIWLYWYWRDAVKLDS